MVVALFMAGIVFAIGGIIIGIAMGTFWGVTISVLGGLATACLFFGVANILQNQETMIDKIQGLSDFNRKTIDKKTCSKCNNTYDGDLSSCPFCGFREA